MIGWVFETLIASALLMALVLMVRERVTAMFGARIAYMLWLLPFVRMLLPRLPEAARPPVALPLDFDLSLMDARAPSAIVSSAPPAVGLAAPGPLDWLAGHWPLLLIAIWLGGALLHFAWQIGLYRRFLRLALAGSVLVCRTCGIAIHQGPAVGGPAAVGIVRRRILLPDDFTQRYDPVERRLVLAHEVEHHQRGDLVANGVALAMLSLHWFNPLAHRAYRAFRADQELACDATVLAGEAPELMPVYGKALVKSVHGATPSVACAIGTASMLKRRLRMMAKPGRSRARRIGGQLLATATILGGLGLTASGSVASPSRLPGVQYAVGGIEGSGTSFSYRNSGVLHQGAVVSADAAEPAANPVPAPRRVETADATRVARHDIASDAPADMPAPPPAASPAPPAAPPAPPAPPEAPAEIAKTARIAAAEARRDGERARTEAHAEAERARAEAARDRGEALAEAGRERAQARAEAARGRVEAAQARAVISNESIQRMVATAMAQARAQMAAACPNVRPATGPESDTKAITRLAMDCVDRKAIHAQIRAAFRQARAEMRNAPMREEDRDRAIDAMERAFDRIDDRLD